MTKGLDIFLCWGVIYAYTVIAILLLTAFVFNKERLLGISTYMLVPAFIVHSAVFIMRWYGTGYFPANGKYENGITSGWFAIALTLFLFLRRKGLRGVGLITVPGTLLALGYGIMTEPGGQAHGAALKSSWLIIHVLFAQLAFGAYLVASGLGLLYILKDNKARKNVAIPFYEKLPKLPVIEETMFKFVVYGFIADAIMIAAGSIWAKDLWGSYWSWDPVEVWSLVSWLIYGLTIHFRVSLGWRGRILAWILILAILGIIVTYWGVNFFMESSQHVVGVK
ncbi:MAG: cytochrome c biogenesis protein CcsA [Nitrospirae bacterium]|nr:cytochrome c biogenesis protein CcsA [Nitrospirota bacterium]